MSHATEGLTSASTSEQVTADNTVKRNSNTTKRFPRPMSTLHFSRPDENKMSGHNAFVTRTRTPSPSKSRLQTVTESPPADILKSLDNATLAKAYGSILQPPETLPIHTCAICSTIFAPDATIYPDPTSMSKVQFLCRHCFAKNGGSKGPCAVCGQDVLTAVKEGPYIEFSGTVWHKRCFLCNICNKAVGDTPMVDLYGKPSCIECFDTCTTRRGTPEKKLSERSNIGGMKGGDRESSPALDELSERLGIARRQESTRSPTHSLQCYQENLSGMPTKEATSSPQTPSRVKESPRQSHSPESKLKLKETSMPLKIPAMEGRRCQGCTLPLFNNGGDDQIVTVPNDKFADTVDLYHASCFQCVICGESFKSNARGQTVFVREDSGACHPEVSCT